MECSFKYTCDESVVNNNVKELEIKELEINKKFDKSQKYYYSLILTKKFMITKLIGGLESALFKTNRNVLCCRIFYLRYGE